MYKGAENNLLDRARFPGFYKLSIGERLNRLHLQGWLSKSDLASLQGGHHLLGLNRADKMIENVIGVMSLPLGLGLNFQVNAKDYILPLVVEEPSIIAALSAAAKLFRQAGGVTARADESLLIGQVQIVSPPDAHEAKQQILRHKATLMDKLNRLHPGMLARGGGVKDIEVRIFEHTENNPLMVIVHLLVDTCDVMGANVVNAMCEEIAADLEAMTDGRVFLRILSNLTDRALVRAWVKIPKKQLEGKHFTGTEVRDGIILASQFAAIDPYRAATHNKGIMNGIDPLAVATGNDWRAIEAAAHAYAAKDGRYTALTTWEADTDGNLLGKIDIPIKVGIKGGSLEANETIMMNQRMLRLDSAKELAELMAAVGLAQNFSAIKALSTEGIQKGHMSLHARSVVATAEAPAELFERIVTQLIEAGDISVTAARKMIAELTPTKDKNSIKRTPATQAMANGKIILLGEHAVVYGRPALAVPINNAVVAEVSDSDRAPEITVPAWDLDAKLEESNPDWWAAIKAVFTQLEIAQRHFSIHVKPNIPAAMGLGGSAAIAVAIIRAVSAHFHLHLEDEQINQLAFQCETAAHGTPSGIDNTIATYGVPVIYQTGASPRLDKVRFPKPLQLVIGMSERPSLTVDMVAKVRGRWQQNTALYEQLFDNFARVAETGIQAAQAGNYPSLGQMMSINQGLLNALQVSSPELESMVQIACDAGALGAKLTGAGGGGSIVALGEDRCEAIVDALNEAGFKALQVTV